MTQQRRLLVAMLAAVSLVAVVMLQDERREFDAAVRALEEEQLALSMAIGADFGARLAREEDAHTVDPTPATLQPLIAKLLGGARALEQPGLRSLLVALPGSRGLFTTKGRVVSSPILQQAWRRRASGVVVPREESPRLGLSPRIAVAGIQRVPGSTGEWGVVVLASGERLRTRERHAQWRFLLGLGVVAMLVASFGGLAFRQQRQRLEAARQLDVAALERDRDRLLAKTDKMTTMAALSSGIAHEVATPLGIIMARIEQVLPLQTDAKAGAALQVALEQVDRIQNIIRAVLRLARGGLPAAVRARPQEIADCAVALVSHRFGQAAVRLEAAVGGDLPAIRCDPPMIEQALTNLLLNACDASGRGSTVRLCASAHAQQLRFVVEDEGEGINQETIVRAHEPFYTTKPQGRGTGLGLAIAQEIVAHHGGKLTLENRNDVHGTRATIELPRT